ncbi:unnamed protein product [Scytosiphon promiscuus]
MLLCLALFTHHLLTRAGTSSLTVATTLFLSQTHRWRLLSPIANASRSFPRFFPAVELQPLRNMDVDNAPPVDTVAMAAAAFAYTANRELPSDSLPSTQQVGNLCAPGQMPPQACASAAAVAPQPTSASQGLQLGSAPANAPAGRDENIVRALAFAEDGRKGVRKSTGDGTATVTCSGGGGRADEGGTNVSAMEEIVVSATGAEADVPTGLYDDAAIPPVAAAGSRGAEDAAPSSIAVPVRGLGPEGVTEVRGNATGVLTKSENGLASASADRSLGAPANGGAAAGSAGEDDDVGSGDEDNDDYTWFSSERRASGGDRKHGRGKLGVDKVYDRIRINDNAEEMNTLRQHLSDGTVSESDGRKRMRQLEDKVFTVRVGDTIEINSGNDLLPYVGKLDQLDRRTKRCRVRWYFVGHEIEEHLRGGLQPREILISDRSSDQPLDTINRKVETVSEMPPGGKLPANTYLCYRGYDMRRKEIVPLLEDGSLDRNWRRRVNQTKKELARASSPPRTSSAAGVGTPPPHSSAASTIMSPSQEDGDRPNMVLLERWNRVGPEFEVAVPAWTGPSNGKLAPPASEQEAAQKQFNRQHQWSSKALPFTSSELEGYLGKAKAIAPIFPGTIVYIRPDAHGRWGDGSDRKQARPPNDDGSRTRVGGGGPSSVAPRLTSMARSTFRWGLVSEPPSTKQQEQLGRERGRGRRNGGGGGAAAAAASSVGVAYQGAAAGAGAGVPLAPQPQWFVQQQQRHQPAGTYAQQLVTQDRYRDPLFGNARGVPQPPNANPLRYQEWLQHNSPYAGYSALLSMSGLGKAPGSTPAGSASTFPASTGSSSTGVGAMPAAVAGEEAAAAETFVWIANPVDENVPLKVERSRVMGREFEEEAMNVLWDARGAFDMALEVIGSKGFREGWKKRLGAAGEIWTFQQVEAAVKSCNKMAADRRNHEPGEMGDECTDERAFGIPTKPFRSVLDFERRYAGLASIGERRRVVCIASSPYMNDAAATVDIRPKRKEDSQGTYNDARPRRPAPAGVSSGGRGTRQDHGSEEGPEDEEEQEESSDDSEDTNYDPNDSEGSSLIFMRSKGKRRRRTESSSAGGDTDDQEDKKDTVARMPETANKNYPPPADAPPPLAEVHNLCSSDEEDVHEEEPAGTPARNYAPQGPSPGARRDEGMPSARGGVFAMAPVTVAEAAAAAASRETRGTHGELPSQEEAQDGGEGNGVAALPPREDSPVPGVASDNTGGEAMAPRPQDETGSVLHVFMRRVKATLNDELFDKFVSALSQYRANSLVIGQLVEAVGECFNQREEKEIKLVHEFNSFLPPGFAVKFSET